MNTERAKKNEQIILNRLIAVGQEKVAHELGVDDSTIYNLKAPDRVKINFAAIAKMLAVMGIKCVPTNYQCVDPETFQMIWTGHKKYMELIKTPEQLLFEDPE